MIVFKHGPVGLAQLVNPIYSLGNTHILHFLRERISEQKKSIHQLSWCLNSSRINKPRKSKELQQTLLFLSEQKVVTQTFLFPLTPNSASESFQEREAARGPRTGHHCLFLSVCLCWVFTPSLCAVVLCYSYF